MHPTVRLLFSLALAALCACSPGAWQGPLLASAVALLWAAVSGVGGRRLAGLGALAGAFVASTSALLLGLMAVAPGMVPDLRDSIVRTASLGLRSLGAVWALQGTVGRGDAGTVLAAARQVGAPGLVVSLLFIAYRHYFTYLQRVAEVRRALVARSAGRRVSPIVLSRAAGAMMIHAAERVDTMAMGLVARGFTGTFPTRPLPSPPVATTLVAGLVIAGLAAVTWVVGRWTP